MKTLSETTKACLMRLRDLALVPIVLLMPRDPRKIVFGGWYGKNFSCNPRYLMEYVLKRGGFTCVWIGDKRLQKDILSVPNARFAAKGSLKAIWHMLTAKFYAYNICWWTDLMRIPRCRRVTLIYLTHGSPDKVNPRRGLKVKTLESYLYGRQSWSSATSRIGEHIRVMNLPDMLSSDRMIRRGTPRLDFLIHNRDDAQLRKSLRAKYADLLTLPHDKKWYLYVPTWRIDPKDAFSFARSANLSRYNQLFMSQEAVLIEKHHPITMEQLWPNGIRTGSIISISRKQSFDIDMQELLIACDRLITDYSSVYLDFYLLKRPILHFAFDFNKFMSEGPGFNYDIRDYLGGPIAYDEEALLGFLSQDDGSLRAAASSKIRDLLEYETGHACEGYYELLMRLSSSSEQE